MTNDECEQLAIKAAKGNNGGEWATHYTEEQKEYWRNFVKDLAYALITRGTEDGHSYRLLTKEEAEFMKKRRK